MNNKSRYKNIRKCAAIIALCVMTALSFLLPSFALGGDGASGAQKPAKTAQSKSKGKARNHKKAESAKSKEKIKAQEKKVREKSENTTRLKSDAVEPAADASSDSGGKASSDDPDSAKTGKDPGETGKDDGSKDGKEKADSQKNNSKEKKENTGDKQKAVKDKKEKGSKDKEDTRASMPALDVTATLGKLKVRVTAKKGVFPAGTKIRLKAAGESRKNKIRKKAKALLDADVKDLTAVDISFTDASGKEVKPADSGKVKIMMTGSNHIGGKELRVVRVEDNGNVKVVKDAEVKNELFGVSAEFSASDPSVYAIVGTTLETNVLTSDGQKYKVTLTCGADAAIPEGSVLKVREIAKGSEEYKDYLKKTEDKLDIKSGTLPYARFFDITILKDGKEIQPAEGSKVDVDIQLEGADIDHPRVLHFGKNKTEIVDSSMKKGTVSFKAEGFSVYAVVDENVSISESRMTVEFYNGSTKIATMYVKNRDTREELEYILYDPGVGNLQAGELFSGWILDNENYTSADIPDAMTIDQVRDWAGGLAERAEITEGEVHRFYAAISKLYHVNYVDDDDDHTPLGMVSIPVKASEYGTADVSYTVSMAYTPKDDVHNFEGWILNEDSVSNVTSNVPSDRIYDNGDDISIKGDVTFTVNEPAGHWLIFDQNGKGATYNAPQFVKADGVTREPRPDSDMIRRGYTFGGWYDTREHADAHAANTSVTTGKFEFGRELTEKKTVYASWIPNTTAPYTVIFWTQNQDRTAYEVAGSVVVQNGTVGSAIPYNVVNNGAEDYVTGFGDNGHYTGFGLKESDQNQQVTITPEGDAVLNLHYDRIEYNFKFYLYRNGTQNNRYDYANNSGNGRSLNDLVIWHTNQTEHPGVTNNSGYTIQSETIGGRTYYYAVMHAYYGENISDKWLTYDKISGANGREAVSYVMMVGTKLKPNPTSQGSGTVKGLITVLNENILGATNDPDGNYVMVRFPDNYNNWRYHIWFETVDGEDYGDKPIHEYNGKTYYEETILVVRSSNTTDSNQNEPKYEGFDYITRLGQNASGTVWQGGHWTTTEGNTTLYHLNYVYDRQAFPISYFDGNYVDGSGNTLQNHASNLLHKSQDINQGAEIPDADKNYVPDPPEEGYVFEGWYLDEGCTTPYTWSTMPVGGIKVYAKWRQEQFRVFLHPNAGTDDSLDWGDESVQTSFRANYGDKVNTPTGKREGSGYEFVGWYTDPSLSGQYLFNSDTVLNNDTVTTPYDQTEPTERDKWGNPYMNGEGQYTDEDGNVLADPNKDHSGNRFWVTRKLDLYAKWRKVLEGATGINVEYSADDTNGHTGTNAPLDPTLYPDQSEATAQAACTAPVGMEFRYWVIQKWDESRGEYIDTEETVVPGQLFRVDADLACKEEDPDNPSNYKYTMRLRAEYAEPDSGLPTHIWWFKNYSDDDAERHDSFHQDIPIKINEGIDIQSAPERDGYRFLGWARVPVTITESADGTPPTGKVLDLGPDDVYLKYENGQYKLNEAASQNNGKAVTKVAADERQPYHDMYAVWEKLPSLSITKTIVNTTYVDTETEKFCVCVKLFDAEENPVTGDYTYSVTKDDGTPEGEPQTIGFDNNGATFSIHHGETIKINNLDNGIKYQVQEIGVPSNYTVSYTGQTGTLSGGADSAVTVTNTAKTPTITGIKNWSIVFVMILLLVFAVPLMLVVINSKKRRRA